MNNMPQIITRFAPSPTGFLHPGHGFSARLASDFAKKHGGRFLLRIEDIDHTRCKLEYEQAIYEDLHWIGLDWERPVRRQSDHMADYQNALDVLEQKDLLYPCFCSRRDIRRAIGNSSSTAHSLEGPLYPGTCRNLTPAERKSLSGKNIPHALRLDMEKALALAGNTSLIWTDLEAGEQIASPEILRQTIGDAVLSRKEIPTSYHLSVVVDDHLQNITHVIRGRDLFPASHLHRLLQFLLGYDTPVYLHHGLIQDGKGNRFAKRNRSKALRDLRAEGQSPDDLAGLYSL